MKQYDFKPLIDFITDDITLIELSNSLSYIFYEVHRNAD